MTIRAEPVADAVAPHFDVEAFADFAFAELLACPLGEPGRCQNPDCQRPFDLRRDWQRYCSDACRAADKKEFRRVGLKAAPALLAHRLGKYETRDPALRALSAAARRYLGELQTHWLRSRRARAEEAKGRFNA
ncbi:hypothetical protein [Pararhodobacter zhoushanensis]|uniref:Uncharacterized protein n=1 Tax=Pararhodobacter zhoushanensis TaxID=2479545 RepID=A0ABT3H425_9RHOB|nr:hypothetical protein [Pararhodobacter zhoushanensis]MCW1934552.1 hypothetical protein [Pararhodobacter zhoushanensis]